MGESYTGVWGQSPQSPEANKILETKPPATGDWGQSLQPLEPRSLGMKLLALGNFYKFSEKLTQF